METVRDVGSLVRKEDAIKIKEANIFLGQKRSLLLSGLKKDLRPHTQGTS